jgi:hypothetical protein
MIDPELEDLVNDLNSIERLEMAAKLERWGFELRCSASFWKMSSAQN